VRTKIPTKILLRAIACMLASLPMRGFFTIALLGLVGSGSTACGPSPRDRGDGVGVDSGSGSATGDSSGSAGDCPQGTELVYTIDQFNNRLSQFDPMTKAFNDLGSLSCPTMLGATPFSMSVDRNGVAWVLYNSGELMHVTIQGLACTRTTWASPSGLKVFGMGFSTDQVGGSSEHLYIGGGASQTQSSFTLAQVDPTTMMATPIGTQPDLPEMTGTGSAQLWGFQTDASTAHVVQFDKTNGTVITTYPEPSLAGAGAGYAFAAWGGDFWVFLIRSGEASTTVYQVDGMTGTIKGTTPTTGRTIVGAGVSTCAPSVVI
jgi:hypothetical protein